MKRLFLRLGSRYSVEFEPKIENLENNFYYPMNYLPLFKKASENLN